MKDARANSDIQTMDGQKGKTRGSLSFYLLLRERGLTTRLTHVEEG